MSQPVWFITGVSNGFGLLLTLRALKAGHRVVGTLRNKAKHANAVKQIEAAGGEVVEMDMTESQASIYQKVKAVGTIDYLINNAGYCIFSSLEQMSEKEVTTLIATNLFGPIYVMQAALEGMRARRSGLIVNLSSIAAKDPLPASALYAGSKAALEATSEALQREVESFGISILIVEPGAFRTNFLSGMQLSENPLPDDYKNSVVGQSLEKFAGADGKQAGDPEKGIERIFEAVTGEGMAGELKGKVLRLVIGEDALTRMKRNNAKFVEDFTVGEKVALSTGYDS
ncbi:putative short-chain dehydrogenase [Xylariaceae sp. FL1651]|nr:putative short-chain dehydrogenase [Xylariaceae sp. FL1651]